MDNVLHLLQQLGEDASLRHLPAHELKSIINPLNLDPVVQQAILEQDDQLLATLLRADHKIVCMIYPAEEPTPAKNPDKQPADKPEPDSEPEDTAIKLAV